MTTKLNNFLSKIGEGVKPNMFVVDVSWPTDLDNKPEGDNRELVNLLCKSTALPASNIGVIEVPFRGRTVKIAGDRTFDTWTATFFNDKDFKIRSYFEKWLEQINTHESNNAPLFVPTNRTAFARSPTLFSRLRKRRRTLILSKADGEDNAVLSPNSVTPVPGNVTTGLILD